MGFMNSFKRLEKTCNEMYNDIHSVKLYISEMESHPDGARYVYNWANDLRRLKHYNWVRNQISHEPDRTEENMCDSNDAKWVDNFHARILSQDDPLYLYRKAKANKKPNANNSKVINKSPQNTYSKSKNNDNNTLSQKVTALILIILILIVLAIMFSDILK